MPLQYLVTFSIEQPVNDAFTALIPQQRYRVDELMQSGKILTYSLTKDMSSLYVVFQVSEIEQLDHLIEALPLSKYMKWDFQELLFHLSTVDLPAISLN